MDEDTLKKLGKMLDSGEISQDLYEEMVSRWDKAESTHAEKPPELPDHPEEESPNDGIVSISGSGVLNETSASEIRISGSGKITGDIRVKRMSVSGGATSTGHIDCSEVLLVSGSLSADGNVKSGTAAVTGALSFNDGHFNKLVVQGGLKAEGVLVSDSISNYGHLSAREMKCTVLSGRGKILADSIETQKLSFNGLIETGYLKGEELRLRMAGGSSRIDRLDGGSVDVSRQGSRLLAKGTARIGEVNAAYVKIDHASCGKIVADEAIIGPDCTVDYLEAARISASSRARIRERKAVNKSGD